MTHRESEKIFLEPISGKKRIELSADDIEKTSLYGGFELKSKIKAKIRKKTREKTIRFVERQGNSMRIGGYINGLEKAKKAGLPVPPTLRRISECSIAVSDLSVDGSIFLGKAYKEQIRKDNKFTLNELSKQEELILSVTEKEQFMAITERANSLADLATINGIRLPIDDPLELKLKPDGTWDLVILDLQHLETEPAIIATERNGSLHIQNRELVGDFLKWIREVRGCILAKKLIKEHI
jgi:hypothetical protein